MSEDVFARATANRRRIADLFASLDEAGLAAPSLCAGWTNRDVLGHLVMSMELGFGSFLLGVLRDLGRPARTSDRLARRFAARPVADLVATLRQRADDELAPPGIGPMGPMADTCIHLCDVAVPLGLETTAPLDDWRLVLDFLTTSKARHAGFVSRGRLDGLAVDATDLAWSHGSGAAVHGPAQELALAMSGRSVALTSLAGDGVELLRGRLA